ASTTTTSVCASCSPRATVRFVATGAQRGTVPSEPASATAAPGPNAAVVAPTSARMSPSVPGTAPYCPSRAEVTYSSQAGTAASATAADAGLSRTRHASSEPSAGSKVVSPARVPLDSASQPSAGHVAGRTF